MLLLLLWLWLWLLLLLFLFLFLLLLLWLWLWLWLLLLLLFLFASLFFLAKGSLVRKLPSYGRMSRGSLVIIMSTSCHHHLRVGAVEESDSPGTCEFTGENALGCQTLWFFRVMWLPGSRSRVSVSGFGARSGKVVNKKCTRRSESSICTWKCWKIVTFGALLEEKDCHIRGTFGRWGRQNAHKTVARARFVIKIAKSLARRSSAESSPL